MASNRTEVTSVKVELRSPPELRKEEAIMYLISETKKDVESIELKIHPSRETTWAAEMKGSHDQFHLDYHG
ncbi:hypothetical protein Tco_0546826 [Tanacetum coccineum]